MGLKMIDSNNAFFIKSSCDVGEIVFSCTCEPEAYLDMLRKYLRKWLFDVAGKRQIHQ